MAKDNLDLPVCLVTKKGTNDYAMSEHGKRYASKCFDDIVVLDDNVSFIDNTKGFSDGRWQSRNLPYYNSMQTECYKYSPFDETILLDADYLVMSNNLNQCWGSALDFTVNYYSHNFGDGLGYRKTPMGHRGMNTIWSTCVYFRKSEYMDKFFDLVSYIKEHWQYYYSLYGVQTRLYRNDYVFTIAHHIMNGFVDSSGRDAMPVNGIHVLTDINDVHVMPNKNELVTYLEVPKEKGNYVLSNISGIDVHVQNKWAIMRISDRIREIYE